MADKLLAVKGMNDILPPDSARWEWIEENVRSVMRRYGYGSVRTPIVEPTALFVRGIGEATDIVEKEMYSFTDRLNGDALTLRPENTAGVVRAAIEHNLLYDGGKRVYYLGPMFRHERPQRGRYRQFYQFGIEALGYPGPEVDAEVILIARALFRELGLMDRASVRLEINSLGQLDERRAHRAALIAHFERHADQLDDDARRRLHSNPLRILDTKNPAMRGVVEAAPVLTSYLGEASLKHFDGLKAALDAAGQPYVVNPRLVRGLDYYNLSVFEWITDSLGSQGTLCGGGRYDPLIAELGGKPNFGIGFAMGVERVLDLVHELGLDPVPAVPDVYLIVGAPEAQGPAVALAETLRAAGVAVLLHAGGGSMKSQFKRADGSGAAFALILGADELAAGEVSVKPLRDAAAAQVRRPIASAADWAEQLRKP
jgi:histidyl-tRNA synthetase